MDEQKEFEEAAKSVGNAFAKLIDVAFNGSATGSEAVSKIRQVFKVLHKMLILRAIEAVLKKKGE